MYKPVISLVNGEIIKDLLDLCNDNFINSFIQPYSGANAECMFCLVIQLDDGSASHKTDCPVIKYQDIAKKHSRFIVKK